MISVDSSRDTPKADLLVTERFIMRRLSVFLVAYCFYLFEVNASPAYNNNNVDGYHIGGSDCKYTVF